MRKILFALPLTLLFACSGNQEKTGKTTDTEVSTTVAEAHKYACPMQCEGDKTYEQAGKCPVCKMDLQQIVLVEKDTTGHAH